MEAHQAADRDVAFVLLAQDVTAAREVAEAGDEHRRVAESVLRLEEATRTRGELLTNITHELRSPVIQISGLLDLLASGQDGPLSQAQARDLADAVTSATHLRKAIDDTLDLARVEAGKLAFQPSRFDVADALAAAASTMRTLAAEAGVRIVVEADATLGQARLDPDRFRQAVVNFLANAVKFSPRGGTVTVRARQLPGAWFRVEVEDAGPGIPEADVPRLFTDFGQLATRASRIVGGTGLGLALTRRLVEAQSGRVGVQAGRERGCVFFAVFPREPVNVTGERRLFGPADRPTVLVAEPDPTRASALVRVFEEGGLRMRAAESGEAVLECAESEPFDALVVPLVLPDMTGLDVLRTLRARALLTDEVVVLLAPEASRAALEPHAVHSILDPSLALRALPAAIRRAGVKTAPQRSAAQPPPRST